MHTNKSESQCEFVRQTVETCGIWGSRLDTIQRARSYTEKKRAKGEWLVCGVKETDRKGERWRPQAACPVFVYNKKPLFDVAAEPLLQTRLLLPQDVLRVRCQTETEDWKTCRPTPRKMLRTLESVNSLFIPCVVAATPGRLIAVLLTVGTKAWLLPSQTLL